MEALASRELLRAAKDQDLEAVKALLRNDSVDVNVADREESKTISVQGCELRYLTLGAVKPTQYSN